jgi:hypothetical protein
MVMELEELDEIKNEQYVSMIVQAAIPPATMTTQEIAEATNLDPLAKRITLGDQHGQAP